MKSLSVRLTRIVSLWFLAFFLGFVILPRRLLLLRAPRMVVVVVEGPDFLIRYIFGAPIAKKWCGVAQSSDYASACFFMG